MQFLTKLELCSSRRGSPKSTAAALIFFTAPVESQAGVLNHDLSPPTPIKYIFRKSRHGSRMSQAPDKRLRVLQGHLTERRSISENAQFLETVDCHASGGCSDSYCVTLPENLTPQGPWLVRRSVFFSNLDLI
jgi:hypothetical protein